MPDRCFRFNLVLMRIFMLMQMLVFVGMRHVCLGTFMAVRSLWGCACTGAVHDPSCLSGCSAGFLHHVSQLFRPQTCQRIVSCARLFGRRGETSIFVGLLLSPCIDKPVLTSFS
jgi:hypothetical protein